MCELDAVNEMMDKVKKIVPKELRFCKNDRICRETIFELCTVLYEYVKDETENDPKHWRINDELS
jgi:hypothetical protein